MVGNHCPVKCLNVYVFVHGLSVYDSAYVRDGSPDRQAVQSPMIF